ncbi:MAG: dockerin type I domain-containing protein [Planctomycetota bacterium]
MAVPSRRSLFAAGFVAAGLLHASPAFAQPVDVTKTRDLPVYVHYMPWFETPDTLGGANWGFHWTLNNQDPNIILPNGQRQIASHFYPLAGAYDSRDADVIEYHLLLMKYAGIDGVLIDWYGIQGTNGDIATLLSGSEAVIDQVDDFGLDFGIVLEDRFSANTSQGFANVAYVDDQYFPHPQYIRDDATGNPLLLNFGPITFNTPGEWSTVLAGTTENVDFLTLPNRKASVGANGDGEYVWVFEDEAADDHLQRLSDFYTGRAQVLNQQGDVVGGSAYPGFVDFYVEGGLGDIVGFEIPHNNALTLADTLALADLYASQMDFLQLVTWNDFGEGTVIEPTVETGFEYLLQVQQFTGVSYGLAELQLAHTLLQGRKQFAGMAFEQSLLDSASEALAELRVEDAVFLFELLGLIDPALPGDANADGVVDLLDFDVLAQNFGSSSGNGASDGDFNADGVVDLLDFDVLAQNFGASSPAALPGAVPEPASSLALLATWGMLGVRTRPRRGKRG